MNSSAPRAADAHAGHPIACPHPLAETKPQIDIKIGGMMCDGCVSRVSDVLAKVPGVIKASVSLKEELATVEVRANDMIMALQYTPQLVSAVEGIGFEATPTV